MSLRPIALGLGVLLVASCGSSSLAPDGGGSDTAASGDAGDPATTLREGLAAAWAFDGDGKDHSGKALDLTVTGLSFPGGKFGKGVQFAGKNGSPIAQRPINDPSLDLTTGDFTVSFWLNFANSVSAQFVVIKGYVQEQGWFVGWARTVWAFGYPSGKGGMFADPNDSPTTGVFHHVVFERTGDTAQVFVDGKLLGGATVQDRPPPQPAPLQVGGFSSGGVGPGESVVDGVVDDVAIWHRALTGTERTYLSTHAVP